MTSTYIVQDDTIGVAPMSRVPTKVKFLIQYTKKDNTKINLLFIIPMTSFIEEDDDNGFTWKYTSSTVLKSYMEKSILYLTNNTYDDRAEIRKAILNDEYNITGIQALPDGSKKRTSLDHTYEDYIEDFFCEYMNLMGDYSLCEYIDIFAKLSHHKIESSTNLEKPDDLSEAEEEIIFSIDISPTRSINDAPVPDPLANIATVHHNNTNVATPSDQHISNVPVVTINNDEDDDDTHHTNNVLDASAPTFTPHWRNSPTPTGPWKHPSVSRNVTF